jgi:BirA family biotin operon repressor/biotin-[acetyl-CoA-carboxylase] ligase
MSLEIFDYNKIIAVIEPEYQNRLAKVEIFDTIDSTNTYLLAQAKLGAPSGTICLAEEQSQGRGRRGRNWFSPPGANIYFSFLWRFTELENISGLSIAVAVMVANALRKYGVSSGIELKWPNDVLFAGRKLAGILLERNDSAMVIGIGLNLFLPDDADSNWIAVQEIVGREVARNYLTGLLANEMLSQLSVYQLRGLSAFMAEWRKRDVLINKAVTVHTAEKIFFGVMKGINEKGELLLQEEEGGLREFCYGEVSCRLNLS